MSKERISRREFLKLTGAAALGAAGVETWGKREIASSFFKSLTKGALDEQQDQVMVLSQQEEGVVINEALEVNDNVMVTSPAVFDEKTIAAVDSLPVPKLPYKDLELNSERVLPRDFSNAILYWEETGWIKKWSKEFSIDPLVIATLLQIESCGFPQAMSPAFALGIGQVMYFHFKHGHCPWDVETNMTYGLKFLNEGIAKAISMGYSKTEAYIQALRGYNAGLGIIGKPNAVNETARYQTIAEGILYNVEAYKKNFFALIRNNYLSLAGDAWLMSKGRDETTDKGGWTTLNLNSRNSIYADNIRLLSLYAQNWIPLSAFGIKLGVSPENYDWNKIRNTKIESEIVLPAGFNFDFLVFFEPLSSNRFRVRYPEGKDPEVAFGACDWASGAYQAVKKANVPGLTASYNVHHSQVAIPDIEKENWVSIYSYRGERPTTYGDTGKNNKDNGQNMWINNQTGRPVVIKIIAEGNRMSFKVLDNNKPLNLSPEKKTNAEGLLDTLIGIPYKNINGAGYKNDLGLWCPWDGIKTPVVDNIPGLNCGGFLVEAGRTLFGKTELSTIKKQPLTVKPEKDPGWLWYGYDEVVSLSNKYGGKTFLPENIGWLEGAGFSVNEYQKIAKELKIGKVYFISVNRSHPDTGRIHHHVAVALPTANGIFVYEGVEGGSKKISFEDFAKKSNYQGNDYRIFLTEISLP